ILSYDEVAYDWESNGNHLTRSRGFCISFCVREGEAYVVPRYLSGMLPAWSRQDFHKVDDTLREILQSDIKKIGHEIRFDNCISKTTLGIWPANVWFCTLTAHHLYANHLGGAAHSLKACADAYTRLGRYDDPLDKWLLDNGYVGDRGKPDMGKCYL